MNTGEKGALWLSYVYLLPLFSPFPVSLALSSARTILIFSFPLLTPSWLQHRSFFWVNECCGYVHCFYRALLYVLVFGRGAIWYLWVRCSKNYEGTRPPVPVFTSVYALATFGWWEIWSRCFWASSWVFVLTTEEWKFESEPVISWWKVYCTYLPIVWGVQTELPAIKIFQN